MAGRRKKRARWAFRAVGICLFAIAMWFVGVHSLVYIEDNPKTNSRWIVLEYRVFGIPVYERTLSGGESIIEKAACDLGYEAMTTERERFLWKRLWGMCVCAAPCNNGIIYMSGESDSVYERDFQPGLFKLIEQDPNVTDEFRQCVLDEYDGEYWREFAARCRALSAANDSD